MQWLGMCKSTKSLVLLLVTSSLLLTASFNAGDDDYGRLVSEKDKLHDAYLTA